MKTTLLTSALFSAFCVSAHAQETPAPQPPLTAAETATLFKAPLRVTLSATDSPVSEVYQSLLTQAHLTASPNMSGAARDKVTFEARNQPFWDAALGLQKASGWGLFHGSSGRGDLPTYSLAKYRNSGDGLKQSQGPCDAYISGITRTRTNTRSVLFATGNPGVGRPDENGETSSDELKLSTVFYVDPLVPVVPGSPHIDVVEGVDENGLTIFSPGSGATGGDLKAEARLAATPDAKAGRKLARLRLKYNATVALDSQTLTWADVSKPEPKIGPRGDGVENYEVVDAKTTPAGYRLTLHAYRPTDGLDFRVAGDAFFQDVHLIDATGKDWRGIAGSTTDKSGVSNPAVVRKYEASMLFGRPGDTFTPPLQLKWTIPSRFRPLEATFEWKDVPLP